MKKYTLIEPSKTMDNLFPESNFYYATQFKGDNLTELITFCDKSNYFKITEDGVEFRGEDEIFFLKLYEGDYIIKDFGYGSPFKQISKSIFEKAFKEYEEVH